MHGISRAGQYIPDMGLPVLVLNEESGEIAPGDSQLSWADI